MVVVSILGFLSAIVIGALSSARVKARDTQRLQTIKQYEKAISLFYDKYGRYPDSVDGIAAAGEVITPGGQFETVLKNEGFLPLATADPKWNATLNGGVTALPTFPGGGAYSSGNANYYYGYRYNHGVGCDPVLVIHKFESASSISNWGKNDPKRISGGTGGTAFDILNSAYVSCPEEKECYPSSGGFSC